jgi:hypothetical protein
MEIGFQPRENFIEKKNKFVEEYPEKYVSLLAYLQKIHFLPIV